MDSENDDASSVSDGRDDYEMEETEDACLDLPTEESKEDTSIYCMDADYLRSLRHSNIENADVDGEEGSPAKYEFILMDIDIAPDKHHGTAVLLFGRTFPSNQSIHVNLLGWYPSLCIEEPADWKCDLHQENLKMILRQKIRSRLEEAYPYALKLFNSLDCDAVIDIKSERGTNIMGYSPSYARDKPFLKIWVASPLFVKPLRECFEGGYLDEAEDSSKQRAEGFSVLVEGGNVCEKQKKTCTFNSNFEPVLQFMVDLGISGCQWCRVSASPSQYANKRSNCDVEILDCSVDKLQLLDLSEKSDAGSVRVLSFDLEAAGRKGVFPDPAIDPVIQIGIQLQIHGASLQTLKPILLSFKHCAEIEGADVFSFESEASMLVAFR